MNYNMFLIFLAGLLCGVWLLVALRCAVVAFKKKRYQTFIEMLLPAQQSRRCINCKYFDEVPGAEDYGICPILHNVVEQNFCCNRFTEAKKYNEDKE